MKVIIICAIVMCFPFGKHASRETGVPVKNNPIKWVNVKDNGAKGDGVSDDTQSIINSIKYAGANGLHAVYFPAGTYLICQPGISTGIIPLLNGVSLIGVSPALCHIKLSGSRYNPSSMFYQAWWDEPSVNNILIEGIDFDGNLSNQKFDKLFQYCHAVSINNGENIEIRNCKFESFRGDGCLFGDTFLPSPNLRITTNVTVHNNEFYNIYREGAMFCCVNGASFYGNFIHGAGFFVGGVDIERHSVNETVKNVSVYKNIFDFRDGFGPAERGGPIVRYRRAVAMGFFYKGYANGVADGLSGGHRISDNRIYQGQIDCWGHTDVKIVNNFFKNTSEDITGVGWLSAPVINISDPASTKGLKDISISNNIIFSAINGNGILVDNYSNVSVKGNQISGPKSDGINIFWSGGIFESNSIKDIGTKENNVSGFVINGTCAGLIVEYNHVIDSRNVTKRCINYVVAIQSANKAAEPPKIEFNTGKNIMKEIVSEFSGQKGFVILKQNRKL